MTRHPKPIDQVRKVDVKARVTAEEKGMIDQKAKDANLTTAEFIRRVLLNITSNINSNEVAETDKIVNYKRLDKNRQRLEVPVQRHVLK
jgi:hypothetical protein